MASSTSGTSVAVFTCLWLFVLISADQQQITVDTGHDVTLQCLDPRGGDIELLEWKKRDLKEDVYVCKQGMNDCEIRHPSFKNRVELRDPQMKDGNVSVILKNVTIKDTGTYECLVRNNDTPTAPQSITNITLTLTDQQQITVETGHDVTLQCLDPRGGDIELLEWKKRDLKEDVYVCKQGMNDCEIRHPSFKNRVELRDPQMKDGNVSVILKNVTIKDAGTYECRVRNNNQNTPEPISITNITLAVKGGGAGCSEDGGDKDRRVGLIVSLSVCLALLFFVFLYMIHRKCNRHFPPADEATSQPEMPL